MSEHAGRVEALIGASHRRQKQKLVLTTNDVLAPLLFSAIAHAALERRVEVVIANEELPLQPGRVDLALRPKQKPAGDLRGRRLGRLRMAVYQSALGFNDDENVPWISPSKDLRKRSTMRWLSVVPFQRDPQLECNSLLAMRDACRAGLGRTPLPVFLAEDLVFRRALPPGPLLWLLAPATRYADSTLVEVRRALSKSLLAQPNTWV